MIDETGTAPEGPLDASPMTRPQLAVLLVVMLLAALDGYDLLGMALAAPALTHAWHLDKAVLGVLLSASLMGMAFGSVLLSPMADIVGRRPLVLAGTAIMMIGSLLSAYSQSVPQLGACRVLTGIGLGIMVPLTATIASEFASARHRSLAVAMTTVGLTAGTILGGLVAAALLTHADWTAIFLVGAAAGGLLLLVVLFGLPESPAYLISRQPPRALERLNRVLKRLQRPLLEQLPPASRSERTPYRALFTGDMIGVTLGLLTANVLSSGAVHYLINWLPQMIADLSFPPSTGSLVSASYSSAAMVGGLVFGALSTRWSPAGLCCAVMMCFGLAIAAFGFTPPVLQLLILSAGACGFLSGAVSASFFATMADTLPPPVRASGMGVVTGLARVFSVAGPGVAGLMFAAGLHRPSVSVIFAVSTVLGGLLLLRLSRRTTSSVTRSQLSKPAGAD